MAKPVPGPSRPAAAVFQNSHEDRETSTGNWSTYRGKEIHPRNRENPDRKNPSSRGLKWTPSRKSGAATTPQKVSGGNPENAIHSPTAAGRSHPKAIPIRENRPLSNQPALRQRANTIPTGKRQR